MTTVVIEEQNPMMHRAKIRLGIALALLTIALVSLMMAGKSKGLRPVPQKAPVLAVAPRAVEQTPAPDEVPPPAVPYEIFPDLPSSTAEPELEPSQDKVPPTVAEAPAEPAPRKVASKEPASHIKASASGDFVLQVGVFADMNNAEKRRENLSAHGIESRLESKLRIGSFTDMTELEAAREKLQSFGINAALAVESTSRGLMLRTEIFSDLASVRQLQSSVDEHGFATRSETRVLVGPFDSKNSADAARSKIRALNMAVTLMHNN